MRAVTLAALIPIIALTLGCAMGNGSTNEQLTTKISTNAELRQKNEPPVSFA